ncbi:MAG: hypothetical protein A2729_01960 [Candidatus Buchananbacteria bacterium RIFCSPHIGHO2_01_FULL_39_14]|uniref:Endonuclease/exonuclease/phosphatase domain-containing protein n=2 Tax=Candidatus Buchananiibacteriota TaxID=1817903 RepID=A0A1G1YW06_9BACT|nr:MAG: hypothetical protein A2729_01960 [Candidatus Buchananbacteria bacterium RIFCSPHIGHO2_01_FULL_39_14]OGY48083.1 MAG: hypothetical protein A3D39_02220 [Candidatus Buchananbacteria bacterium RIFCSPHIGHO2_02_FULL_39_17]OGY55577.1 MAG: hypothetical protein A2912_02440 [Candidatus Buchananbacteria bacterium RIFCSPLOWO2_01_FULL_40_23b]
MRILLYNIDHGGKDGNNLFGRWPKLIQIFKDLRPDMAVILEAWNWRATFELKSFAKKTNFKYYFLSPSNTKHHLGLLTNIQPKKIIKYKNNFHHSVLRADFKNFTIFGIHLNSKNETKRIIEAKKIIGLTKKTKSPIVLGDFNSLSPQDDYNDKELFIELKRKKIDKFGKEKLEKKVIKKFITAGLIDAFKAFHPEKKIYYSVPTKNCRDINHLTKLRLDYAFVDQTIIDQVNKIKIIKNQTTDWASDHYPLILELS